MIGGPYTARSQKNIGRGFLYPLASNDTSFRAKDNGFRSFQSERGMVKEKVNSLPFVGLRCPSELLSDE